MKDVIIDGRMVGRSRPPYIIAELSANHNGKLQTALDTIRMAKSCGADAVKLQTYTADTMTIDCDSEDFVVRGGIWNGRNLYDLYREASTPYEWHREIFDYARSCGITCFSTPFDESAVDLLEDLGAPAYKIASFEATDLPLISYAASTKKPLIMSTGMANLEEIEAMVTVAREAGNDQIILLHCISAYPAPLNQFNLLTLPDLRDRIGTVVGLSDHSLTNTAAIVSTSLGASVIEKHFILDRSEDGPDSSFSITPDELAELCAETKNAWESLGCVGYERKPAEQQNACFRRSIYFVQDMKKGDVITADCIRRIRPGYGLDPKYESQLIGKKVSENVLRGTPTCWDIIDE